MMAYLEYLYALYSLSVCLSFALNISWDFVASLTVLKD